MLRVAITGGPGSGKSTLARMFAALGAHVVSSDEIARSLMEPEQDVYRAVVAMFGDEVVQADGLLDRKRLAQIAFSEGRVRELEDIVHPAVLAWQDAWAHELLRTDPMCIAMIESALVFESPYMDPKKRFNKIILVTASDETKRARFVQRALDAGTTASLDVLQEDARGRLALQLPDEDKIGRSDFVLRNDGAMGAARTQVESIWRALTTDAAAAASN